MSTTTHSRLTPAQFQKYEQEGYLLYKEPVLSQDKFAALKATFERILADLPGEVRPESMDVPHLLYPELFQWLLDDEVLDLVRPILGPDIALFSSHFICKPKGTGKRVPWHEDSAYWKGMMDPMEVCTVWLAIDPSRRENGCMQVIPRTHVTGRKGFSDYDPVDPNKNVFPIEIKKMQRDESKAVACILEPNEASLHDGRIMHGSEPNTSDLRRCGYTMRYISTRTRFNHEKHGQFHNIYLASGIDHAGNRYGDSTKAYTEMAMARTKYGKTGH